MSGSTFPPLDSGPSHRLVRGSKDKPEKGKLEKDKPEKGKPEKDKL